MDQAALWAAVKELAPDMEICVGVETWGSSKGCHSDTTWQIYLSVPGTFYRGATPEAALDAFKAVYGPKPQDQKIEIEQLINSEVSGLISSRQSISPEKASELGLELTTITGIDLEISENLVFWYSRMFTGDPDKAKTAEADRAYQAWLDGAVHDRPAGEITAGLNKRLESETQEA